MKNYDIKDAYDSSEGWMEGGAEIINIIDFDSYPKNHVLGKIYKYIIASKKEPQTKSFIEAIYSKKYESKGLSLSYDMFIINTGLNNHLLGLIGNFLDELKKKISNMRNPI